MSKGRRQRAVAAAFERVLAEDLDNRVLTSMGAQPWRLRVSRPDGRNPGDQWICATGKLQEFALARRATLATRNVRHFEDLKIPVVNPWQARVR
jgi:predicted nucleic acid-binding protein